MPAPVSVIIPTQPDNPFLISTLRSVAEQRDVEWTVTLVLDGDCERNRAAAEAVLPADRVQILTTPAPRSGPATARNIGLAAATGDLAAFLDADDLCHPERLARQAQMLRQTPGLGLVGARARTVDPDGAAIGRLGSAAPPARLARTMLWFNCLITSTVMARRDLLLSAGKFDPRLVRLEDYDLWLRLLARADGAVMEDVLLDYRVHPGQLSRGAVLGPATRLLWRSRLALARRVGVSRPGTGLRHAAWYAVQLVNRRW